MKKFHLLVLFALSALMMQSCIGMLMRGDGGKVTCDVDGDSFTSSVVVATNVSNELTVTASGGISKQVSLIITDFNGTGTYEVTNSSTEENSCRWTGSVDPTTGSYTTMGGLGSGTIEVTDFSEDRVEGTFSFTAKNQEGGEVEVTNGAFDADIES